MEIETKNLSTERVKKCKFSEDSGAGNNVQRQAWMHVNRWDEGRDKRFYEHMETVHVLPFVLG